MRKLSFFLIALLTCAAMACQDKTTEQTPPSLKIDNTQLTQNFEQNGLTSKTLTVLCNQIFTAVSSEPSWCKVEVMANQKADNLRISVSANENPKSRTAEVVVKSDGAQPLTIKITQIGQEPTILVKEAATGVELADTSSKFTLEVTTNLTVSFETPDWIEQTKSRAIETSKHDFTASALPTGTALREGAIKISGQGAQTVEVKVKQSAPKKSEVRFAVISDTHFNRESAGESASVRAKKVLDRLFAKHSGQIDAIFIVGDMTDNGTEAQWDSFREVYYQSGAIPAGVAVYPMLGNHDLYTGTPEESHARFLAKTGLAKVNNYTVINGTPFITISQDAKVEPAYSDATQQWVASSLADATLKYPNKPIFVFSHLPVKGTSVASNQGSTEFAALFEKYPQIIFFCAHTHHSVVDPRSIYQSKFTAINTGSAWYAEVDGGMIGGIEPEGHDKVTEGQIVSVGASNDVTIERWDVFRDELITPPYTINAPHDGTQFLYKDQTGGAIPTFGTSAKPIASEITESGCLIKWPQASDDDKVYRYKVSVHKASDNGSISSAQVFSQFYWNSDMPDSLSYSATGLSFGVDYYAKVSAVDTYGNESLVIQSDNFQTVEYTPSGSTPVADLMDIVFTSTKAIDRSASKNVIEMGSLAPTYKYDPMINGAVGEFTSNAGSHYRVWYKDNAAFKTTIAKAFTIETYIFKPNTAGTCPFSAQQQGGFGIEFSGNSPELFIWLGSGYKTVKPQSYVGSTTQYMHLLYSYDKTSGKMKAYIDGVLMGEASVSGDIGFPSNPQAQWIGVGADCNVPSVAESDYSMAGNIAFARMYGKAVSDQEAYNLFYQTVQRKRLTAVNTLIQSVATDLPAKATSATGTDLDAINKAITDGWAVITNWGAKQTDIDNMNTTCNDLLK